MTADPKFLSFSDVPERSSRVREDRDRGGDAGTTDREFDFDRTFEAEYARIARVIARLVQDPGRAEELAVDVFWKLLHRPEAHGPRVGGWLYRTAVREGLDEIRRQKRKTRYEAAARLTAPAPTPEQVLYQTERQRRVQAVLSSLAEREASLLIGFSEGWTYQEIGDALELNPGSVGTLLRRAKDAFRREYVKRYGNETR